MDSIAESPVSFIFSLFLKGFSLAEPSKVPPTYKIESIFSIFKSMHRPCSNPL